jgi:hypothetical protein
MTDTPNEAAGAYLNSSKSESEPLLDENPGSLLSSNQHAAFRSNIRRESSAAFAPTILHVCRLANPLAAQLCQPGTRANISLGVDYLDLCRQYGIVLSITVALDRPEPLAHNQCPGTNPIGRARVSGSFNPASMRSHRTTTPALHRATSQNPPDSLVRRLPSLTGNSQ